MLTGKVGFSGDRRRVARFFLSFGDSFIGITHTDSSGQNLSKKHEVGDLVRFTGEGWPLATNL